MRIEGRSLSTEPHKFGTRCAPQGQRVTNLRVEVLSCRKGWAPVLLLLAGLAFAGCSSGPAPRQISGVQVPLWLVQRAEGRSEAGAPDGEWSQARACEELSRRLWYRDKVEALGFLHRGAFLGDGECALEYLAQSQADRVSLSLRLYVRLALEKLVDAGPVSDRSGRDVGGELRYQLHNAWRTVEPCDPARARRRPDALNPVPASFESVAFQGGGGSPDSTQVRESLRVPDGWPTLETTAWSGGTDKLWVAAGVIALVVNANGEPSHHGEFLWIRNTGTTPVYYSGRTIGRASRELLPKEEHRVPIPACPGEERRPFTSVPLVVRHGNGGDFR